ncbi:DUF4810 domain-containing protein [Colwellia sp. MSW7]|uniref:DUF4810 domain-containing protein n=1 Tax=Colwellia maritima TaxID=2912588 RepID=A0ABS9WXI3_9GAMM|nr:DUF4810 domain-containing protein [Colwellia maritima]MCI2282621.1 DUF4810 domain-containing protein [Colwellia maritima]
MKTKLLMVVCAALLATGCANKVKPMYEYGEYSETFYTMKRDVGENSLKEWKVTLEDVIQRSGEQSLRVPPGVYANLGYLYLKVNDSRTAISYFELEKSIYPESVIFMNNLISKIKVQGSDDD